MTQNCNFGGQYSYRSRLALADQPYHKKPPSRTVETTFNRHSQILRLYVQRFINLSRTSLEYWITTSSEPADSTNMSAAKRPASNSFGSSQMVVKRQKSSADINGKAVAVTNGSASSGALMQAVSSPSYYRIHSKARVLNDHNKKAG